MNRKLDLGPAPQSLTARAATWFTRLFDPVDAAFLVYFRVIFGSSMLFWVSKTWLTGIGYVQYVQPSLHFSYYGFEWLQPTLGNGIYLLLACMGVAASFMIIGYCYRCSAIVYALGFTYLFLLDKTTYQNHYYLISLVSWLMVILPANRLWSVDAWQRPSIRSETVPTWTLWLLRFQIGLPYFYGGIAKISPDWLAGEPMRMALAQKTWYPVVGPYFTEEWMVMFFVWGGMLFDLIVVPGLLWRKTRFVAYLASLAFHIMNVTLWPIGVFPWFMMLATVVFFDPDWPRRLFRWKPVESRPQELRDGRLFVWGRGLLVAGLMTFVALHLLVPFRFHLYEGDVNWTEEAHHFSWHMLLRSKRCGVRLYATDPKTGRTGTIDLRKYVTPYQASRFGRKPRNIHQLARFVAKDLEAQGFEDVEIRALALISLNGRKPQLMVDPNVNLAAEPVTWGKPDWIVPLHEPLRKPAWDVPLEEWEQHLEIPEHFVLTPPTTSPAPSAQSDGSDVGSSALSRRDNGEERR